MELTIRINMDNAAFEEPEPEAARILRVAADRIEQGRFTLAPDNVLALRDINGNTCAGMEVTA